MEEQTFECLKCHVEIRSTRADPLKTNAEYRAYAVGADAHLARPGL
jgi:hypothetical protein